MSEGIKIMRSDEQQVFRGVIVLQNQIDDLCDALFYRLDVDGRGVIEQALHHFRGLLMDDHCFLRRRQFPVMDGLQQFVRNHLYFRLFL